MGQSTFRARPSGDMECFCWDDVPEEDMKAILGEARYKEDVDEENKFRGDMHRLAAKKKPFQPVKSLHRLYPGDILGACGIPMGEDKQYRFTLIVEEISKKDLNKEGNRIG